MNKEYRINMFFIGGTTFSTTVPEDEKDKIIECLNDRKIEKRNKIIYREKMGLLIPDNEIVFYKNNKWIGANLNLDMQELKAIYKKCEELGWI